jgi:hypothetical protein
MGILYAVLIAVVGSLLLYAFSQVRQITDHIPLVDDVITDGNETYLIIILLAIMAFFVPF